MGFLLAQRSMVPTKTNYLENKNMGVTTSKLRWQVVVEKKKGAEKVKCYIVCGLTFHWVQQVFSRHVIIDDLWVSDLTVWAAGHGALVVWCVYIRCVTFSLWIPCGGSLTLLSTILLKTATIYCTAGLQTTLCHTGGPSYKKHTMTVLYAQGKRTIPWISCVSKTTIKWRQDSHSLQVRSWHRETGLSLTLPVRTGIVHLTFNTPSSATGELLFRWQKSIFGGFEELTATTTEVWGRAQLAVANANCWQWS